MFSFSSDCRSCSYSRDISLDMVRDCKRQVFRGEVRALGSDRVELCAVLSSLDIDSGRIRDSTLSEVIASVRDETRPPLQPR